MVAGLAGGLAGTIVMTGFQVGWQKTADALESRANGRIKSRSKSADQGEDATEKAAAKIAKLADQKLTRTQKKKGGAAVHYAFGTALGTAYGIAREYSLESVVPTLAGVSYGSAVFVGAHEFAVPALGLAESPKDAPLSERAFELGAHLVYGLTSEVVRKTVRGWL
jgi:uncharacterized membrane protein YagU involved in acid resistance